MKRIVGIVAAGVLAALAGCGDGATSAPPGCSELSVSLPSHPIFDDEIVRVDRAALDRMAQQACVEAGGVVDINRFLFGAAPSRLFDQVLARGGADAEVGLDLETQIWVLYVSGYFGGLWLRGEIVEAQPDSLIAGFGMVPDRAAFLEVTDDARPAWRAATASDAAVIQHAVGSRDFLVDNFGYNKGYLLQILEDPPEGLTSPPDLLRCFGPLDCRYQPVTIPALLDYDHVAPLIANPPTAAWADVSDGVLELQDAAEVRGRGVWSAGLSVQGFSQEAYETLLDVSASFLEAVQATTLASIESVAEEDGDLGRQSAAAEAGFRVWVGAYTMGLLDPRDDGLLPAYE